MRAMRRARHAPLLETESPSSSVATQLLLCKVLYFLNGFSGSSFGRFATIFYIQVCKLSAVEIGYVEAAQPIASAIGNQLLGWLTDRLQRKKAVSLCCRVLTTALLLLLLLPQVTCCVERILAVMASVAFFGVGGGVLDSYTLDLLGDKRRGEYGKYRLWLAVSWGLGNAAMGQVAKINFNYNFYAMAGLNLQAILLMAVALPSRTQAECKRVADMRAQRRMRVVVSSSGDAEDSQPVAVSAAESSTGDGANVGPSPPSATFYSAFCHWRMVAFLAELAALGVGFALVEKFLFVYAMKELGADTALCGYSVAVTVVFELPIFQYGDWLLRHWGHDLLLWLAVLSYCLRVLGYTQLTKGTVWYLLALEPFHGITFGLAWTAAVDKMKRECPDRWQTTGQLLLNTMMWSVGRTVGSLFGGFWYHHGSIFGHRNGRALYWVGFLGGAGLLMLHTLLTVLLRCCGSRGLHSAAPLPPPTPQLAPAETGGEDMGAGADGLLPLRIESVGEGVIEDNSTGSSSRWPVSVQPQGTRTQTQPGELTAQAQPASLKAPGASRAIN